MLSSDCDRLYVSDGERIYVQYVNNNKIFKVPELKIVSQVIVAYEGTIFLDANGNMFFSIQEKNMSLAAKNVKSIHVRDNDIFALIEDKLHHYVVRNSRLEYCCKFAQGCQNICVCFGYVWFSKDNIIFIVPTNDHKRRAKEIFLDANILNISKAHDSIVVSCETGNAYRIEYNNISTCEPVKIALPSKLRLQNKQYLKNARKV